MSPEMMLGLSGAVILMLFAIIGFLIRWIISQLTSALENTRQAMHDLRDSVNKWKLDVVDRMARIEERARLHDASDQSGHCSTSRSAR